VVQGHAHITGDVITSLFSAGTRGAAPRNNWLLDVLFDMVAFVRSFLPSLCAAGELANIFVKIAVPVWRSSVDKRVEAHREEHEQYLQQKGFFT
jgi:3-dehydrosphinganine reductase